MSRDYDSYDFKSFMGKAESDKAFHTLQGLLEGILFDKKINSNEIEELLNWFSINEYLLKKLKFEWFKEYLLEIKTSNNIDNEVIEKFEDLLWVFKKFLQDNEYFKIITSDMQRLQGILHGILADNKIDDHEIYALKNWLDENEQLKFTYPYEELNSLLVSILADKKIDDDERNLLKVFFSEFIDLKNSYNLNESEILELKSSLTISGICSICPDITIKDNKFCISGESSKYERKQIVNIINELGGNFNSGLVKDTNYLIVGSNESPCWTFSCYGRKIEKAIEMRKKGNNILIVHENDFWDVVQDSGYSI